MLRQLKKLGCDASARGNHQADIAAGCAKGQGFCWGVTFFWQITGQYVKNSQNMFDIPKKNATLMCCNKQPYRDAGRNPAGSYS